MTSNTIYEYEVFCIEENTFVTTYGKTYPTLCPNDHADRTINPEMTHIVKTYETQRIKAEEDTRGDFTRETIINNVPSGAVGDVTIHDDAKWDVDIFLWKTILNTSNDMIGDYIEVRGIKNDPPNYNICGVLSAEALAGTNILSVSDSAIEHIYKGIEIELDNNGIKENVGIVTNIDNTEKIVTVKKNLINTYPVGTFVRLEIVVINQIIYDNMKPIKIASKGMKGKNIKAGDIMRVKYTNNNGQEKTIYWDAEYYNIDSV